MNSFPQHGLDEVAVADPVDFDLHHAGVDADDRDAALADARQHIGVAREVHEGGAIADVDVELDGPRQGLMHG